MKHFRSSGHSSTAQTMAGARAAPAPAVNREYLGPRPRPDTAPPPTHPREADALARPWLGEALVAWRLGRRRRRRDKISHTPSTLEAELRAHKALTILHSRDVQVEQLQQRVAQLQSAADRVCPVNLVVPPLRLPPSPGSDEGFACGCDADADADGSDNDLDDQDDDVYVEMLSDSGPSSDSLYSDTAGDSSEVRGGVCSEVGADPLPPPLDFARVPTPPPPRPARQPASASASSPPPSPPPADAPPGPQPRKLPCHLATDAGIRPPAPWGIGGGDRDTLSCAEIERRRKRKLGETNRKRKVPQRPGSHSYPLRADLPAAAAAVAAAAAAAEERGLAAAAAAADPRAAPRLGDGPCLRSCLTLDAQEAAGRLGEEAGAVAAAAAVAVAGRPDCGDCTSPAAGDHATCHRLIDELRLYNKQLRAALRLAQASQSPVAGAEGAQGPAAVPVPPPPAPQPPPPAASRSVQTLGERLCDGASQTDVAAAADRPAQTSPAAVAHAPAQTSYALPTLKDIEAERKEARSLAAEAARQAGELQEVRRRFCDLQLAHEALQTQLRHQAVVDELKRHTMEELRERLEQLERSVADADADADDAASDAHEGDADVFADAETDVGRDVPPQWMLEAAICRAHARGSASEARGAQTELEGAQLEALGQRVAAAQLEAEEQRLAARALGERLAQLSKAAARQLQAKRKHVKKQIEKAVKRRVRALCRAVSDAYGLTLTPHDLLLARRSEASEVSSEDWSAGEGSEGSIVAVEGTPSPATSPTASSTLAHAPTRLPRHAPLCRRADLQAATRRLGAVRKQLRLTRVSYLRAKKKIVRQERCLKAKQVYHAYLETTLGGLRAEAEELQREVFATKLENDRLLERVRRLEAGEAATVKQASEAKATESKTSRPPTRRRVASCVRRSQRATSLPPPALQVAPAPPAPPSTPASPSPSPQQQQPPSTPLSGAASVTASLALVPLPPLPPPPAPGEEPARASDDERRKMLNARLRAATQNIAALNKMVNNLRQQLQASEDSLQRCKERLNRVEACNQNRLQLVESYKVKTQDLEQRLETALSKSTSQLQTIDALRNNNSNLKCQLAKVTTQRDDCIQEAITVRKTLEEQLGRKTSELQARAVSETEQKIQEAKLHYARCTSEQNRKLKEAAEKLNQFGHSIETFLKMVQQRERGMYCAPAGLLPAGDDRPQRQEALARAATILNLTPTQLHNFMADPGDTNRRREFTQWMSYCRQLFCRDVFSQLLAEFLFKVVLAKFEPDFVQGLTDKDLS